jgi:hypothetical protein
MERRRTRQLALRDEGARHPFRLTLPREILQVALEEVAIEEAAPPPKFWQKEDVQLFLFSFVAFFTAFYLFIF